MIDPNKAFRNNKYLTVRLGDVLYGRFTCTNCGCGKLIKMDVVDWQMKHRRLEFLKDVVCGVCDTRGHMKKTEF